MTIDAQMLKKFEKMTEDLLCSICNTIMEDPHALHCGHSFCGQCILTWLKVKKACPMCRVTIIRIPTHINVLQKLADTLRPADDVPGERLNESDWLELFPLNQDASRGSRVEDDGTSPDRFDSDFGIHNPANYMLYEGRRRGIEPSDDEERSEEENITLILAPRSPRYSVNDNVIPLSPDYYSTSPINHEHDNHSLSEDEARYLPSPRYFETHEPESDFHSDTTRSTPEFNDAMFRHDIPDDDSDDSRPIFYQDSSEDERSYSSEHERYYSHDEQEVYHNNYSSDDEQQYSSDDVQQQQYSSDDQQRYSSDEEQQQYYSEQEQQFSSDDQQRQYSSDDQQQHYSSDDQQQQYSSDDQQQQYYSSDDQQQQYFSEDQQQYSSDDQQHQYSSDEQQQQYSSDDEPPNVYSSEEDHNNGYSSQEEPDDYNNGYSSQEDIADMDTEEDNYNHNSDYSY